MVSDIISGRIHNRTDRLTMGDVTEAVESYVYANGGPDKFPDLYPVFAAPADDSERLTEAVRDWREADGAEVEFTQHMKGAMVWFGFRYRPE